MIIYIYILRYKFFKNRDRLLMSILFINFINYFLNKSYLMIAILRDNNFLGDNFKISITLYVLLLYNGLYNSK